MLSGSPDDDHLVTNTKGEKNDKFPQEKGCNLFDAEKQKAFVLFDEKTSEGIVWIKRVVLICPLIWP